MMVERSGWGLWIVECKVGGGWELILGGRGVSSGVFARVFGAVVRALFPGLVRMENGRTRCFLSSVTWYWGRDGSSF